MSIFLGFIIGVVVWFLTRYLVGGLYTVDQNERAVKTSFGRADRIPGQTTLNDPISEQLMTTNASATSIPRCASFRPAAPISNGRGRRSIKSPSPRRP